MNHDEAIRILKDTAHIIYGTSPVRQALDYVIAQLEQKPQWVCEEHPDKPWGGISDSPNACNCGGAGALREPKPTQGADAVYLSHEHLYGKHKPITERAVGNADKPKLTQFDGVTSPTNGTTSQSTPNSMQFDERVSDAYDAINRAIYHPDDKPEDVISLLSDMQDYIQKLEKGQSDDKR